MTTSVDEYWMIPPDWSSGISEKRAWQTGIQTSINAVEKRSTLLTWPRRTLTFDVMTMSQAETAWIRSRLHGSIHKIWGCPFWQDRSELASDAASGQTTLTVDDTQNRNYEIGGQVAITTDFSLYEIATVQSFTNTVLTLTSAISGTWTAGTSIYPVLKCRLASTQKLTPGSASTAAKISIEATETYDNAIIRHIPGITLAYQPYLDIPVFGYPPDWNQSLDLTASHAYTLLKFLGVEYSGSNITETRWLFTAGHLCNGKYPVQIFRDFFDTARGRWGTFWRPTWQADIQLTAAVLATDVILPIMNSGYETYWAGTASGRYIMIRWPDNSYVLKKVTVSAANAITIDSAIGMAITSDQLPWMTVSLLHLSRFDQDEMEIKFITEQVATISLNFMSLPMETPS